LFFSQKKNLCSPINDNESPAWMKRETKLNLPATDSSALSALEYQVKQGGRGAALPGHKGDRSGVRGEANNHRFASSPPFSKLPPGSTTFI
jgi:hypothetical protein